MANRNVAPADIHSRLALEQHHHDGLALAQGTSWWGNRTKAGQRRLEIRAAMAFQGCALELQSQVLELGSSDGQFTRRLLSRSGGLRSLVGADASFQLLRLAKQIIHSDRTTFVQTDACSIGFKNETFDVVIGNAVLHHLPIQSAVKEILRVLKSGGLFLFFEPNMLNPQVFIEKNVKIVGRRLQNTPDETAFVRWKLKSIFQSLGLIVRFIEPFDFLHPMTPAGLIPLVEWAGKRLERIPVIREIAGSLYILGEKPI